MNQELNKTEQLLAEIKESTIAVGKSMGMQAQIIEAHRLRIAELEKQLADATSCNDNCTAKVKELKAHHKTLLSEKESYSQKQMDKLIVENAKLKQHHEVLLAEKDKVEDWWGKECEILRKENERLTQHAKNVAA